MATWITRSVGQDAKERMLTRRAQGLTGMDMESRARARVEMARQEDQQAGDEESREV